jgi:hypothetical protein
MGINGLFVMNHAGFCVEGHAERTCLDLCRFLITSNFIQLELEFTDYAFTTTKIVLSAVENLA